MGKIALGALGATVLGGVLVAQQGMVHVRVVEKAAGGDRINLYLPAALIPVAVRLAPEDRLRQALERARGVLRAMRIAGRELQRLPDSELVEVRDQRDHVRIRTMEGNLVIEVKSDREDVHLSVPLKTLERVAEELQARSPGA